MPEPTTRLIRQKTERSNFELHELSRHTALTACDEIRDLGRHSIHESSARTITIPADADGFETTDIVKQYYFEGENGPLLIIAPQE